jgi:homocysteine S-methyltransferase
LSARKSKPGRFPADPADLFHAPLVQFLSLYQEAAGAKLPIPILAASCRWHPPATPAFLQQEVPGIDIPPEIHASMQQAGDQGAREGIPAWRSN